MAQALDSESRNTISRCQSISAVLWPSFLMAGVATIIFFTVFDPEQMHGLEDFSRIAVYSTGFFVFWGLMAVSSCATQYFLKPCDQVNRKRNK
ncbi:MAG: hypothetical protein ACFCUJ_01450 [Thiotrichales bacterium]